MVLRGPEHVSCGLCHTQCLLQRGSLPYPEPPAQRNSTKLFYVQEWPLIVQDQGPTPNATPNRQCSGLEWTGMEKWQNLREPGICGGSSVHMRR